MVKIAAIGVSMNHAWLGYCSGWMPKCFVGVDTLLAKMRATVSLGDHPHPHHRVEQP